MFEDRGIAETAAYLDSDVREGLTEEEALLRYRKNGPNALPAEHKKSLPEAFLEQLNDPLIYVLIGAAAVSVFLQELSDAVIIGVVVFVNALVGLIQEGKAQKALDSLKKLTSPRAIVRRQGRKRELPASELVTGDVVCLEAGCQVPADLRLTLSSSLKVEESALTGEALPIDKDAFLTLPAGREIPLGDRKNMVYMSTIVTYGRGEGIVVATGRETEIGKIAAMITGHREEMTPLQKRLSELGKVLSILSLFLCAALFAVAVIQKRNILEMLLTAISLAVAAVPEGLPAVVTICLALSVTRMVRVNAIIRRLPSVETLGAVSVVCSDKTGTLTQNQMRVERCFVNLKEYDADSLPVEDSRLFLQGMTLCNDAAVSEGERIGDPTELALLELSGRYGMTREALERRMPRTGERSFDSVRKMMSTCHQKEYGGSISFTKGAPEVVLGRSRQIWISGKSVPLTEHHRRQILREAKRLSGEALRTLAVAVGSGEGTPEENLIFLGMAGMKDPPRPEAAEAVSTFQRAGVATVMITGDHVDTAFAIGRQLGIVRRMEECMSGEELSGSSMEELQERLDTVRVFARVSPAQKVEIVRGFQRKGQIVAMTGDGVNDAPSLKTADIGIAMGMTGTDVARQASDMILADDNFATIEKAIEEGRGVYENIRKSVIFLLSSNLGEIMTMFAAVLCGFASPLKSSHILWINLITDSLPALSLGIDKNDGKSMMTHTPRKPHESLFARGGLACTCFYGLLIAAVSLTAFLMLPVGILGARGLPVSLAGISELLSEGEVLARAQTYSFTVLGMSQLFHAVGMRDMRKSIFRMNHIENKLMILSCLLGFLLQFAVTEVPFLIRAFGTSHLSQQEWVTLTVLSSAPLLAHELLAVFTKASCSAGEKERRSLQPVSQE